MNENLTDKKFSGTIQNSISLHKKLYKQDLFHILEQIKRIFGELIENFCGVLEDNCLFQELAGEEDKEEVIIQLRELNMFKVLQEEVLIHLFYY